MLSAYLCGVAGVISKQANTPSLLQGSRFRANQLKSSLYEANQLKSSLYEADQLKRSLYEGFLRVYQRWLKSVSEGKH